MIKIAVGSKNPSKIKAVQEGISHLDIQYEITGFATNSDVSDQPWGDNEIFEGAYNRAKNLSQNHPGFDYYIGAEGGLVKKFHLIYDYAYIVILNAAGDVGISRTSEFLLPKDVSDRVLQEKELGPVLDEFFNNSEQESMHNLTNGALNRASFYSSAVICAMSRFTNPSWYQNPTIPSKK